MQPVGNPDMVEIFLHWLRENHLTKTELALLDEIQTLGKVTKTLDSETICGSNCDLIEIPTKKTEEKRILPYPFENEHLDSKVVFSEDSKCISKEDVQPETTEEEDITNFESSLAEQLRQLVQELSSSPKESNDTDEWTDADDLGFIRVPTRPNADYYEIMDDEEQMRQVEQQLYEDSCYQKTIVNNQVEMIPGEVLIVTGESQAPGEPDEEITRIEKSDSPQLPHPMAGPPGQENLRSGDRSSPEQNTPPSEAAEPTEIPETVTLTVENCSASAPELVAPPAPSMYVSTTSPDVSLRRQPPMYEAFDLKVIYQVNKTGFEEQKDYPIRMYDIIAGRYQILEYLGSAAFSRAVQCVDLKTGQLVCVKIIRNNKDFFDQGLDEIKLLHYIHASGNPDDQCVLQLYDYFYHKEHLFLVCELLRDNLYEFSKYNRESGDELYFTLPRLQKITRQILTALRYIHGLNLIHCDLKPENILIKSYSRCEVKVIDFGSSCFTTDHLSSYVQSRCYRAPEVILGLPYSQLIDMWSLGAILAELYSGRVLFHNDSVTTMMARIIAIMGPFPPAMLRRARYSNRFFTRQGVLFERNKQNGQMYYLYPKRTKLHHRVGTKDELFIDFLNQLLQLEPSKRPTAEQALQHPFLYHDYSNTN